jgi:hypothetical protein
MSTTTMSYIIFDFPILHQHLVLNENPSEEFPISFIWPSCYREEDFLEIDQSEKRIACGSHVC